METIKDIIEELGEEKVSTDLPERMVCSADWSPRTKKEITIPKAVLRPKGESDIETIVKWALKHDIPLTVGGGLTGMGGGANTIDENGAYIDSRTMNEVIDFDKKNQTITVQSGMTLQEVNDFLESEGYWIPHLPESKWSCTVGSAIAVDNDSTFGIRYGKIINSLLNVNVVDGRGRSIKYGHRKNHFSSSGLKMHHLFVNSEGTLGIITQATLKVEKIPDYRYVKMYVMKSINDSMDVVNEGLSQGLSLEAGHINCKNRLKFYTHAYKEKYGKEPDIPEWAGSLLAVSVAGKKKVVDFNYSILDGIVAEKGGEEVSEREIVEGWWTSKHTLDFEPFKAKWSSSQKKKKFGACDVGIPFGNVEDFYNEVFVPLTKEYGLELLGMNAYLESVNSMGISLSCAVFVDYRNQKEVDNFRKFYKEMSIKAIEYEGTASTYIGDTNLRTEYMDVEHGRSLDVMYEIKEIFDPFYIMNPDKKFYGGE